MFLVECIYSHCSPRSYFCFMSIISYNLVYWREFIYMLSMFYNLFRVINNCIVSFLVLRKLSRHRQSKTLHNRFQSFTSQYNNGSCFNVALEHQSVIMLISWVCCWQKELHVPANEILVSHSSTWLVSPEIWRSWSFSWT